MILIAILIYAFIGSLVSPYPPYGINYVPRDLPPSLKYPFGTTTMGQDVFWLTAYALKNSLIVGFIAALVNTLIAILFGSIAGTTRGLWSEILTSIIDTFILIPILPILLIAGALWKEYLNDVFIGVLIGSLTWGGAARGFRAMLLSLRERTFISTAILSGYTFFDLLKYVYIPYTIRWLIIHFMSMANFAIGLEATLGLFGLVPLNRPSIGTIFFWSITYQAILRGIWWWYTPAIIITAILFISSYLLSEELNKIFIG